MNVSCTLRQKKRDGQKPTRFFICIKGVSSKYLDYKSKHLYEIKTSANVSNVINLSEQTTTLQHMKELVNKIIFGKKNVTKGDYLMFFAVVCVSIFMLGVYILSAVIYPINY